MCGCVCSDDPAASALASLLSVPRYRSEYKLGKVIGAGRYGCVRQAVTKEGKRIAVKVIPLRGERRKIAHLFREVEILRNSKHPHITEYYASHLSRDCLYLAMELCAGGSLKSALAGGPLCESRAAAITKQLLEAVEYLHQRGIMHRDLKPENVLFDDGNNVKLSDFGLSRWFDESEKMSFVGTPYYLAPEMLEGKYTQKCDIWSLGVMLYAALRGKNPFRGKTIAEVAHKIKTKEVKNWGPLTPEAVDFLRILLERDAEKRLSASELLNHSWLRTDSQSTDTSFSPEEL